ncbi:MAG: trimethylamine methyltransferase [Chloroflexi bacterium]|jgi:trimethylamine---corrinoid protein Co-methyltransferase|nr:trimethylamine methyltransferase [Chloroflexota bacterium]
MKPIDIPTFQPRLKVLSREQALAIHTAALEIIEKTGFKMEHPGALQMLIDAGCTVTDDDWVRMPGYLAENALKSAPRQIALFDQQGNKTMPLVDGNPFYGTGSDTTFTLDLETGQRRRTNLKDTANFAKLVDGLENISFAMSMSNPEDVPIDNIYVYAFAEMIKNTNKPLVFIADSSKDIAKIHQIACAVVGGEDELRRKPFLLNYSEAISPLRFPENVVGKLIFCAQKGIPICFPSGSNAGGGAPVTLAGAMALGIAENLVGLVVHQMAGKGSPFLFGPNVSTMDMKSTVVSYGCPEWSLTQAALADMRDELYGLPVWAYAGASDSKTMDAQAGAEAMFSVATAMLSRCNLIHDNGYLEYGGISSLEMVTMINELIAMTRFYVQGIPVNTETLALDAIQRVGTTPGSMFLTDDHTFDNFMDAQFIPKLLDRSRYDSWEAEGSTDLYKRCNTEAKRILAEHRVEPKSDEILQAIDKIVKG